MTKLGDVVDVRGGGTPRRSTPEFYGGTIPWVTPKDMKRFVIDDSSVRLTQAGVNNSPARLIEAGSVLVVVRSGVLKHTLPVALTTAPVTVNQDVKALTPSAGVHPAFLARLIKALQPRVLSWVRATTADNFPIENLLNLDVHIPPLDEQRRIAALLDQADSLRDKRRQSLALLDDLAPAIFLDMFVEALESKDRVPLKALTTVITKGTTPTSVGLEFATSGIPFLRVQNLVDGTVRLGPDALFIDEAAQKALARSKVLPGDLLVSIAGTIGRCAVVPNDTVEMNCNQAVAVVRLLQPSMANWLLTWLSTQDAQRQIRASSVTGTISNLSLAQLGSLLVPHVSDADVADFNRVLSAVESASSAVLAADQRMSTLIASLQSRAFSGRL